MNADARPQLNIRVAPEKKTRLDFISQVTDTSISALVGEEAVDLLLAKYDADPEFHARRQEWLEAVAGDWKRG